MPMSAVLSVLPLPNVVLLYNVYRLHVNFACMRAATAVCHSELHIVLYDLAPATGYSSTV